MSRLLTICWAFGLGSCGDSASGVLITEHLEVEASDSPVVCRGTLDNLEAQAVRVADLLDVEIPHPIRVYYGPSAVEEHCNAVASDHYTGCARGLGAETYIATDGGSASHELVHAVRLVNDLKASRFIEEGVAELFSGFRPVVTRFEVVAAEVDRGPEFLSTLPWDEVGLSDYATAGHFMSWLSLQYDFEAMASFLNASTLDSDVEKAFAENFGRSLKDAEADWRSTSETVYVWGEICDPQRNLDWEGDSLMFTGRVDCDAPNTVGPGAGRIRTRSNCFESADTGVLRVELVATTGFAEFRLVDDCVSNGPLSPEHFQTKKVLAGEILELPFAPCTWEIAIVTELDQPIEFSLLLNTI